MNNEQINTNQSTLKTIFHAIVLFMLISFSCQNNHQNNNHSNSSILLSEIENINSDAVLVPNNQTFHFSDQIVTAILVGFPGHTHLARTINLIEQESLLNYKTAFSNYLNIKHKQNKLTNLYLYHTSLSKEITKRA